MRKILIVVILALAGVVLWQYVVKKTPEKVPAPTIDNDTQGGLVPPHELSIPYLRDYKNTGSKLTLEETLDPGINYSRYIASYISEGNKIYGLLTVPDGDVPDTGWPLIMFNHGYIPPTQYATTERYVTYQDGFARSGYITFKSDYRGHGRSEGQAAGGYGSNGYTIDVLNALVTLEHYTRGVTPPIDNLFVDRKRIGMWGHSMGGFITLRAMVVRPEIKA